MIRDRELERPLEELGGNEEIWRDMGSIDALFNSYLANRQVKYANYHDWAGEIDEVVVGHEAFIPYRKSLRKALCHSLELQRKGGICGNKHCHAEGALSEEQSIRISGQGVRGVRRRS